jgi:hypothetical protein
MAQRGAWTPQKVRDRIRVSMLMKRLQDSALGRLKDKDGNIIELPDGQRRAIEILLKKTLPDLQSIEATVAGKDGGAVLFQLLNSDIPAHPKAD